MTALSDEEWEYASGFVMMSSMACLPTEGIFLMKVRVLINYQKGFIYYLN